VVFDPLVESDFEGLHLPAIEPFRLQAHFHPAHDVTFDDLEVYINLLPEPSGRLIDGQSLAVGPDDPSVLYVEVSAIERCCNLVDGLPRL